MPAARGRSPSRTAAASASTSSASPSDDNSGDASNSSGLGLRFDDEDGWSKSALGLHNLIEDDPYGTRHLESPVAVVSWSFWRDEPLVATAAAPRPVRRSIDYGRSSGSAVGGPSASLPSTLAFHAFHRTPTTVWQAYRPAVVDERAPTCSLGGLGSATRLASSPSRSTYTQSPLSTPFRGRFLSLDLAPDEDSEDSEDEEPSPMPAPIEYIVRPPASSPMVRSPPVVYNLRHERSASSLSSQPDTPYAFNSISDEASQSVRWTKKGSTNKAKAPPASKAVTGRVPSSLRTQASTGFIKTYKNGKAMHSCEPCRKARHKCIGAHPPLAGQAGVSEQPCQRCAARNAACVFEVLQTRGSSKRYKAVNAGLKTGASSVGTSFTASPRSIPPLTDVFSAPSSSRLRHSQPVINKRRSTGESDNESDADAEYDPFGSTRPASNRKVRHTFIPDVIGAGSSALVSGSRASSSASSMRSDRSPRSAGDPIDSGLMPATYDGLPRAVSLTSSSSDTDDLPLSPPSHQGPLPIRFDSTSGHCYPTSQGALPVGINTDAIGASHVSRQSSSDGSDSLRSLSAFVDKSAARSREPSSSSTTVGSEGSSDEPQDNQPFVAPPSSLWTWFNRQEASPAIHAP